VTADTCNQARLVPGTNGEPYRFGMAHSRLRPSFRITCPRHARNWKRDAKKCRLTVHLDASCWTAFTLRRTGGKPWQKSHGKNGRLARRRLTASLMLSTRTGTQRPIVISTSAGTLSGCSNGGHARLPTITPTKSSIAVRRKSKPVRRSVTWRRIRSELRGCLFMK